MRRGKLNNSAVIILVCSAFFTIISYLCDQIVINNENNLRKLKSDQQIYDLELIEFERLEQEWIDITDKYASLIGYSIVQIDINLKSLIVLELSKKDEYYKKFKSIFRVSENNFDLMLEYLKRNEINLYENFRSDLLEIRVDQSIWLDINENTLKSLKFSEKLEYTNQLEMIDLYNLSPDIFNYQNYEAFFKSLNLNPNSINFDTWFDLRNLRLLTIENIQKKLDETIDFENELTDKINTLNENISLNIDKVNNSEIYINIFILAGIISQILSLLFILLLFRFILLKKINKL